jgi:hypothetical protein
LPSWDTSASSRSDRTGSPSWSATWRPAA